MDNTDQSIIQATIDMIYELQSRIDALTERVSELEKSIYWSIEDK